MHGTGFKFPGVETGLKLIGLGMMAAGANALTGGPAGPSSQPSRRTGEGGLLRHPGGVGISIPRNQTGCVHVEPDEILYMTAIGFLTTQLAMVGKKIIEFALGSGNGQDPSQEKVKEVIGNASGQCITIKDLVSALNLGPGMFGKGDIALGHDPLTGNLTILPPPENINLMDSVLQGNVSICEYPTNETTSTVTIGRNGQLMWRGEMPPVMGNTTLMLTMLNEVLELNPKTNGTVATWVAGIMTNTSHPDSVQLCVCGIDDKGTMVTHTRSPWIECPPFGGGVNDTTLQLTICAGRNNGKPTIDFQCNGQPIYQFLDVALKSPTVVKSMGYQTEPAISDVTCYFPENFSMTTGSGLNATWIESGNSNASSPIENITENPPMVSTESIAQTHPVDRTGEIDSPVSTTEVNTIASPVSTTDVNTIVESQVPWSEFTEMVGNFDKSVAMPGYCGIGQDDVLFCFTRHLSQDITILGKPTHFLGSHLSGKPITGDFSVTISVTFKTKPGWDGIVRMATLPLPNSIKWQETAVEVHGRPDNQLNIVVANRQMAVGQDQTTVVRSQNESTTVVRFGIGDFPLKAGEIVLPGLNIQETEIPLVFMRNGSQGLVGIQVDSRIQVLWNGTIGDVGSMRPEFLTIARNNFPIAPEDLDAEADDVPALTIKPISVGPLRTNFMEINTIARKGARSEGSLLAGVVPFDNIAMIIYNWINHGIQFSPSQNFSANSIHTMRNMDFSGGSMRLHAGRRFADFMNEWPIINGAGIQHFEGAGVELYQNLATNNDKMMLSLDALKLRLGQNCTLNILIETARGDSVSLAFLATHLSTIIKMDRNVSTSAPINLTELESIQLRFALDGRKHQKLDLVLNQNGSLSFAVAAERFSRDTVSPFLGYRASMKFGLEPGTINDECDAEVGAITWGPVSDDTQMDWAPIIAGSVAGLIALCSGLFTVIQNRNKIGDVVSGLMSRTSVGTTPPEHVVGYSQRTPANGQPAIPGNQA